MSIPTHAKTRVRTLFLSDIHLGAGECHAEELLELLHRVEPGRVYLVGDIVDGWRLRRSVYWPPSHAAVLHHLLDLARRGVPVTYVPGNHDEVMRQYLGMSFGGARVVEEAVHVTADGRRLWIIHGDAFDDVVRRGRRWLALLGDRAHQVNVWLNARINRLRLRLGLPYFSLAHYFKTRIENARKFIDRFERTVAAEAARRGYDGVVCGHIHQPAKRTIEGVEYLNDGDWVESLTALAEHPDGRLELLRYDHIAAWDTSAEEYLDSEPRRAVA